MADEVLERDYPGIGRLHYFLAQVGMIAAVVFVVTTFGPDSLAMRVTAIAIMLASFFVDVLRLRNIGLSQWFAFLRYVPFGKLILGVGLLCAQTGWVETKKLDKAGLTIFVFEIGLILMMLFLAFRTRIDIFGMPSWGLVPFS